MSEQLDSALKGENILITSEAKMFELENLAQVVNFAVTRMKQAGGGLAQPVQGDDPESEDSLYVSGVTEFDQGTTDALLVLDREKKVRFVGKALEELIGLRSQYAIGQNISDACRDGSFSGTTIDMVEKVFSSLGESQVANLDINGISRAIYAVAHKNQSGDIHFVLLTVKLNV